ncbi:hypothetical protein [Crossiella sp. CA198]|uniref:hypothetical protein n=1 Tax=Crossiella sp. CA198 TaxID=3455607 RepID=UPI003F8D28A3
MRTADRAVLGRHGEITAPDWLGPRTITASVEVTAAERAEFGQVLAQLADALAPGVLAPLALNLPGVAGGGPRFVWAKVRRRSAPLDVSYSHCRAVVAVEWYCPSPYLLDVHRQSASARLPSGAAGTGIRFPRAFPVVFGTAPDPGVLRIHNAGNGRAYPRLRVTGPVAMPRIVNLSGGGELALRYVLLAGQWLDVNTETREVLLNGLAPRWVTPGRDTWWPVAEPGTTPIAFRGERLDGGEAELTAEWRSAWI